MSDKKRFIVKEIGQCVCCFVEWAVCDTTKKTEFKIGFEEICQTQCKKDAETICKALNEAGVK